MRKSYRRQVGDDAIAGNAIGFSNVAGPRGQARKLLIAQFVIRTLDGTFEKQNH